MRKHLLFFTLLFMASSTFSQGYKTFESVYFEVGDSIRADISLIGDPYFRGWNVRGEDKETLINFLKRNPRLKIQVNAYTDTKGSEDANMERSKLRAASIVEWLSTAEGFDSNRFRHKGWGEEKPLISDHDVYQYRGADRYKSDSLQAINRRIILVIDEVEQKINCAFRSTETVSLRRYYVNDWTMMKVGNRFRLDFVQYEEGGDSIIGFEQDRTKYEELAAFIHCHPGVNFQISVHSDSRNNPQAISLLTKTRAVKLVELLSDKFRLSSDRLLPIGFENARPIIPNIIINELSDEKEKQDELHAINRRTELEVLSIGAFNDVAFNRNMLLTDYEMAREGILYANFEHRMKVETKSPFDSLKLLYSHSELAITSSKINDKMWELLISATDSELTYSNISFLGWSEGESNFLSSKSFEILAINDPEIYLGNHQLSNIDVNLYKDKDLFSSAQFIARFDTTAYYLRKSYPVLSYKVKVGRKKFNEQGSQLSKDLMRAIRKAKPDMIIHFEHLEIQEDLIHIHELHLDYIKKTKTKKNDLFQSDRINR